MGYDALEQFQIKMTDAQNRMARLKDEIYKETDAAFSDIFSEFFTAFPNIKTIHWTQYTPYFADGDECIFNIGEIYFSDKDHTELEGTYNDETDEEEDVTEGSPEYVAARNKMATIISGMEDYLKSRFEDHSYIKVWAGGADREDHDHD